MNCQTSDCTYGSTNPCWTDLGGMAAVCEDCAGNCGGTAVYDIFYFDYDNDGVCCNSGANSDIITDGAGGPTCSYSLSNESLIPPGYTASMDCNGYEQDDACACESNIIDDCGMCEGDNMAMDCNGFCPDDDQFGSIFDDYGTCCAVTSGEYIDQCGKCNGPSNDCYAIAENDEQEQLGIAMGYPAGNFWGTQLFCECAGCNWPFSPWYGIGINLGEDQDGNPMEPRWLPRDNGDELSGHVQAMCLNPLGQFGWCGAAWPDFGILGDMGIPPFGTTYDDYYGTDNLFSPDIQCDYTWIGRLLVIPSGSTHTLKWYSDRGPLSTECMELLDMSSCRDNPACSWIPSAGVCLESVYDQTWGYGTWGDLNCDGTFNILDLVVLIHTILGQSGGGFYGSCLTPNSWEWMVRMDSNLDGGVNILDVV